VAIQTVFSAIQTAVSVVRTVSLSLAFWLLVTACTLQYTSELSRQVATDLGLRESIQVRRSAHWSLPDHSQVYLARSDFSRDLQNSYPRLRLVLDKTLEAQAQERFPAYKMAEADQSLEAGLAVASAQHCNLLLRLSLRQVNENLSSATEWMNDQGLVDADTGRDRLRLVLKVFDVHSGRLLDTLSVDSRSGWWRWQEHQVAELVSPALHAMFEELRAGQIAHHSL
jgi:hypothetical protein